MLELIDILFVVFFGLRTIHKICVIASLKLKNYILI